jgi:hypothetical protein
MKSFLSLSFVLLFATVFANAQTAVGNTPSKASQNSLSPIAIIRGTVVTDIVTPGGDCPHKWWLKMEDGISKDHSVIALEPDSKILPEYNGKRVELEGQLRSCKGTEVTIPVFVIQHIKLL